ncbi:MAG: hypothetical protein IPM35_00240 [Myxococcales bacterium]|nr:hypothetical protein [Myxococcales bacterium]
MSHARTLPRLPKLLFPLSIAGALCFGCGRAPESGPVGEPRAAPTSVDAIPAGPVAGKIAGKPFALGGARFSMDIRPGHEQTDIILTDADTRDGCADLGPKHATSVWLRWTGVGVPPAETVRVGPNEASQWQVHYERYDGRHWVGNGNSSALLALKAPRVDRKLEGDLSVCFGDRADSCVAGNFVARDCPIRIDAPVRGASALEPLPGGGSWGDLPTGAGLPSPSSSAAPAQPEK